MAKYSDIKGFTVQTLDTDPIANTPPTGAWSSGGTMNDGKPYGFKSGGVQTAAISFGAATTNDTANENYNGTSWSENSAMNDGFMYGTGTGSQTDAIAIGGIVQPGLNMKNQTEEWNGSSWTAGGSINTARYNVTNQSYGPGTAAAFVGGKGPDYQPTALHEQYNGSAWTETTDMPTDIFNGSSGGVQTNVIIASGNHSITPPGTSTFDGKTITWNGSAWTEVTEFSTARSITSGSGVYNDFLLIGGNAPPGNLALTEKWNGSSWTEIADISTARNSMGVGKTESDSTSAIVFGGSPSPTITEEFSVAPPTATIISQGQLYFNSTTNTFKETLFDVSGGAWASGPTIGTARYMLSGAGTPAAMIIYGGNVPNKANTESWDGSSWTEVNDLNTAKNLRGQIGTYNAALAAGGGPGSHTSVIGSNESWNGSSWTEVNDLNTAKGGMMSAGTTTAGLMAGSQSNPPGTNTNESWDGTSWTEVADMNTAVFQHNGWGTQTSAIKMGGQTPPNPLSANTETWDGTSWTEVNNLNTAKRGGGTGGETNASGIIFGGATSASQNINETEFWNGTSWSEQGNLGTARKFIGGSVNSPTFGVIGAGGYTPSSPYNRNITEEWTVDLSNKTITAS